MLEILQEIRNGLAFRLLQERFVETIAGFPYRQISYKSRRGDAVIRLSETIPPQHDWQTPIAAIAQLCFSRGKLVSQNDL